MEEAKLSYYQRNKEYFREYHLKHKKKRNEYCRKWNENHKEERRQYRLKHKKKRNEYSRRYHQDHKEGLGKSYKKYRQAIRDKALKMLGNKCFLCERNNKLEFHKKDGQPHNSAKALAVLENPKEFVLLCVQPCHRGVHFCMKFLGMKWEDFEKIFLTKKVNYE